MNIKEIRQKYPQYNDMSDTEFADAFHGRYYSDIPKEDFYKQLGIQTNQRQPYHDPVYGDRAQPKGINLGTADDFIQSSKGLGAAIGDLAGGLVKIPLAAVGTVASKIANPSYNTNELWDAANKYANDLIPSFATPETKDTAGYKYPLMPFEKLGEGIDYLGKKAGEATGSKDVEGAVRLGANFLPIPFLGKAGKVGADVLGALDPTLRSSKPAAVTPSKLDTLRQASPVEQPKAPQQLELPLETSAQSIHEMQTKNSPQLDLFDPANQPNRLALQGEPDRQAAAAYDQSVSQIGRMFDNI